MKHSIILVQPKHSSGMGVFFGRVLKYPKWWAHSEEPFGRPISTLIGWLVGVCIGGGVGGCSFSVFLASSFSDVLGTSCLCSMFLWFSMYTIGVFGVFVVLGISGSFAFSIVAVDVWRICIASAIVMGFGVWIGGLWSSKVFNGVCGDVVCFFCCFLAYSSMVVSGDGFSLMRSVT